MTTDSNDTTTPSVALQLRSGTKDQHADWTGSAGEVTYNETDNELVLHDGTKVGGFAIARADLKNCIDENTPLNDGAFYRLKYVAATDSFVIVPAP